MLIPIGDDNSRRQTTPYITWALIVVNIAVFLMELGGGDEFVYQYSVIPSGLLDGTRPLYTVITGLFLHGGFAHLLGNMLYLGIFGDNVEDNLGYGRYLLFYFLCGIGATAAQVLSDPTSSIPNIGASGAISGVMAAYLILFPRNRVRILMFYSVISVSAWLVLGLWFGTQVLSSYADLYRHAGSAKGGVAYMAHVGGFITGLALVLVLRRPIPVDPQRLEYYP